MVSFEEFSAHESKIAGVADRITFAEFQRQNKYNRKVACMTTGRICSTCDIACDLKDISLDELKSSEYTGHSAIEYLPNEELY